MTRPAPGAVAAKMRPALPRRSQSPSWLASLMLVVAALYFARDLLIPTVLSILICFVLAPVVNRLRRWGVGRITAIAITVVIATAAVVTVGSYFVVQLVDVTMRLPEYQGNIETKIESLRITPNGPVDRAIRMFTRLGDRMNETDDEVKPDDTSQAGTDTKNEPAPKPVPVQNVEPALTRIAMFRNVMGSTFAPLTSAGIVFVLVIFMLLEREALRDRLIQVIGTAPMQINNTTQALTDAAARLSRYLFMLLIVNVSYGIAIGIGLYFIGVPNAALWGLLAAVLRFVPYIGPIIAGIFPVAMSIAVDPGWVMAIETLLLFAVIEIISNNFIETWLYGKSMGISSVAILLSAMFWAWLWGPIGLLISTPLTVCFMVLGRYIPAMRNLSLMLGDQPGLSLHARMYQRFLAMDPDEPDRIAQEYLKDHTVEQLFGDVLVPTLRLLEDERYQDSIEPARRAFILEHLRELIEDFADEPDPVSDSITKPETNQTATKSKVDEADDVEVEVISPKKMIASIIDAPAIVTCIPAHDESDKIVAIMIATLLRRRGIAASIISADQSSAERINRLESQRASIACISVLPPFAAVYARHTVQRIHARQPGMKLIVGFWEASGSSESLNRQLKAVGAHEVVSSLALAMKSILALVEKLPAQPTQDIESDLESRMAMRAARVEKE